MTNPNDLSFSDKQGEYFDKAEWQKEKDSLGQFKATTKYQSGLTKREYFAAMAMSGVATWDALLNERDPSKAGTTSVMAKSCIQFADDVIAELNKEEKP